MDDKKDVGVTTIELDGKAYRLKFSHIAIAIIREELNMSLVEFFNQVASKLDYETAMVAVWASLKYLDEFENTTLDDFRKILDKNDDNINWLTIIETARKCIENSIPFIAGKNKEKTSKKKT